MFIENFKGQVDIINFNGGGSLNSPDGQIFKSALRLQIILENSAPGIIYEKYCTCLSTVKCRYQNQGIFITMGLLDA